MSLKPTSNELRSWVPIRVYWRDENPFVDWCWLGDGRFTDPFFEDTIRRALRLPFSLLFRHQTSLEHLREVRRATPGLAPSGFIFHMSRCGSTLVAQMLAASRQNLVISEAPPIDSILSSGLKNGSVTDEQRIEWLRDLVSILGRPRPEETRYFIKFDSWNTFDLDIIRQAFPDVPWIFLYREPVEVLVSHMRQRGSQMIPGSVGSRLLNGLTLEDSLKIPPEEYCARILARICEEALGHAGDRNGLFVNYRELPEEVTQRIANHFRLDLSSDEINTIVGASRLNAKSPALFFEADSETKRREASEAAVDAASKWIGPLYEEMEGVRANLP